MLFCPQKQCLSGKTDSLSGRTKQRLPPGGSSRRSRVRESALRYNQYKFKVARAPSVSHSLDSSLPEGAFGLCESKVHLFFLTSTAFVDTKAKPRAWRGKNYKVKRALKSSRPRRASKSFQVRYSLKSSVKVDVPLQVTSFES